jgi:hypothetical protein
MTLCRQCQQREAKHGVYCAECLDSEVKDLTNEELQAAEIIYNALGHKMTREEAEARFAAARARLEREREA